MSNGRNPWEYGNPGYGPDRRHTWDTPQYPGGDAPIPAPGVDPMAYQREIEYQQARDASHFNIRQQEEQARQAAHRSSVVSGEPKATRAPTGRNPRANSATTAQKPALPIKPTLTPVKYLVKDSRIPSLGWGYANIVGKVFGPSILTSLAYFFVTLTVSRVAVTTQLGIAIAVSAVCWSMVLYRAINYNSEDKDKITPGNGPLYWGSLFALLINLPSNGFNLTLRPLVIISLIGLWLIWHLSIFLDDANDISGRIVRHNWAKQLYLTGVIGRKCQLCSEPAGEAVAMRRYYYYLPVTWQYYLPVCIKHQYYICEFDETGKQSWPQSGDCTQPGLIVAKPKQK